jgi:hypothetical protein
MALCTLDEYASHPSTTRMTINISGSPWTFEVTNARGIKVRDILAKVCETMNYNVGNTEFQAFQPAIRNAAVASFQCRGGDQGGFQNGLKRFDFMSGNRFFVGLRRSRDGYSWDTSFASLA